MILLLLGQSAGPKILFRGKVAPLPTSSGGKRGTLGLNPALPYQQSEKRADKPSAHDNNLPKRS